MRVLLTLHHHLTSHAGAPGATIALGSALEEQGCEVEYYAFGDAFGPDQVEGVSSMLRFPVEVAGHLRRRGKRFDVVDASTGDAWLWGTLGRPGGKPGGALVTRAHGLEHVKSAMVRQAAVAGETDLSWRYPLYHGGYRLWEVKRSLHVSDHCVLLNEVDREYARGHLGVPLDRLSVMPNAIGPHFFDAADAGPPSNGTLRLAFVGSWLERKGTSALIDATDRLLAEGVDFELSVLGVGQAPVKQDFSPEVRERVSVVPRYDNDELPGLLADREILVFPSLSEGSSVALLEAMACGLVPVATRVGSAPDVIAEGETGALIEPRDSQALAEAVSRLAGDRERLVRMRRAAQERARIHRWEYVAMGTVALYEEVLARRTASTKRGPMPSQV